MKKDNQALHLTGVFGHLKANASLSLHRIQADCRALGRRTLMEPPKEIRNCTVNFQCPKLWKRLATTDDPKVRFCDQCFEQVYLVQNEQELAEQSARGRCVAILNLSPQHEAYSGEGLVGEIEPDWSAFDKFKKDENNET